MFSHTFRGQLMVKGVCANLKAQQPCGNHKPNSHHCYEQGSLIKLNAKGKLTYEFK